MRTNASHRPPPAATVALVVCLAGVAALLGAASAAGGTGLSLDAADDRVAMAETTEVDLVVADAQGGVGGFVARVELSDPDAATITDVTFHGEPGLTDVVYRDGGSRVAFGAVLMDTADGGPVTVATVTVAAEEPGAVDLTLTGVRGDPEPTVADEAGVRYDLTGLSGTSLTVDAGDGPPPTTPAPDDDDDELDLGDWFGSDRPATTATTAGTTAPGTADDGSSGTTAAESPATATTADGDGDGKAPTTPTSTADATSGDDVVTATGTTASGGQPGFGLAVALVALFGAALLSRRRAG